MAKAKMTREVFEELVQIRESGQVNMMMKEAVAEIALIQGLYKAAEFVDSCSMMKEAVADIALNQGLHKAADYVDNCSNSEYMKFIMSGAEIISEEA